MHKECMSRFEMCMSHIYTRPELNEERLFAGRAQRELVNLERCPLQLDNLSLPEPTTGEAAACRPGMWGGDGGQMTRDGNRGSKWKDGRIHVLVRKL